MSEQDADKVLQCPECGQELPVPADKHVRVECLDCNYGMVPPDSPRLDGDDNG